MVVLAIQSSQGVDTVSNAHILADAILLMNPLDISRCLQAVIRYHDQDFHSDYDPMYTIVSASAISHRAISTACPRAAAGVAGERSFGQASARMLDHLCNERILAVILNIRSGMSKS